MIKQNILVRLTYNLMTYSCSPDYLSFENLCSYNTFRSRFKTLLINLALRIRNNQQHHRERSVNTWRDLVYKVVKSTIDRFAVFSSPLHGSLITLCEDETLNKTPRKNSFSLLFFYCTCIFIETFCVLVLIYFPDFRCLLVTSLLMVETGFGHVTA